jgi:hypothetical protein
MFVYFLSNLCKLNSGLSKLPLSLDLSCILTCAKLSFPHHELSCRLIWTKLRFSSWISYKLQWTKLRFSSWIICKLLRNNLFCLLVGFWFWLSCSCIITKLSAKSNKVGFRVIMFLLWDFFAIFINLFAYHWFWLSCTFIITKLSSQSDEVGFHVIMLLWKNFFSIFYQPLLLISLIFDFIKSLFHRY